MGTSVVTFRVAVSKNFSASRVYEASWRERTSVELAEIARSRRVRFVWRVSKRGNTCVD